MKRPTKFAKSRRPSGASVAERLFTSVDGAMRADDILEVGVMDSALLNVLVVDDASNIALGRPYVTIIVRAYSRRALSYVIEFTPPSVYTAIACLRQAAQPTVDLKTRFPEVHGEPPIGVCRKLVVDHSWQFAGRIFSEACANIGIDVELASTRSSEHKAICERFFHVLNQVILLGRRSSRFFDPTHQRHGAASDTVLCLSELEGCIDHVIADVNGRSSHSGMGAPQEIWNGQADDGVRFAHDLGAPDLPRGKIVTGLLSRDEMAFKGLNYRSASIESIDEVLASIPTHVDSSDTVQVKVMYDPADLSKILIWHPVRQNYFEMCCTHRQYATGLSVDDHEMISSYAKYHALKFETEEQQCAARAQLTNVISRLAHESKPLLARRIARRRLVDEH